MVLSNIDRNLLERCLQNSSQAWEEFVDRYIGLVSHVVDHAALNRSLALDSSTRDDLISDVFFSWIRDDFAVLRRFEGNSSLATYLTVVARRIVVRHLLKNRSIADKTSSYQSKNPSVFAAAVDDTFQLESEQQIDEALQKLSDAEATAVRMFHLESRSYREIGSKIGIAENSVGPFLTRAREKMRRRISEA